MLHKDKYLAFFQLINLYCVCTFFPRPFSWIFLHKCLLNKAFVKCSHYVLHCFNEI